MLRMGSHFLLCIGCHFYIVYEETFHPKTEGLPWDRSILGLNDPPGTVGPLRVVPS